jgi:hypothetical protein
MAAGALGDTLGDALGDTISGAHGCSAATPSAGGGPPGGAHEWPYHATAFSAPKQPTVHPYPV